MTTPPKTFIYFIRAGEFVKIGRSIKWKRRLATMQTGSPHTIVPLLILWADPALEKRLHRKFRKDHYRGEWFHMGPALRGFIKDNLPNCVAKSIETEIAHEDEFERWEREKQDRAQSHV